MFSSVVRVLVMAFCTCSQCFKCMPIVTDVLWQRGLLGNLNFDAI